MKRAPTLNRVARDERGLARIELATMLAVTIALAAPFAIFGQRSIAKFVPTASDLDTSAPSVAATSAMPSASDASNESERGSNEDTHAAWWQELLARVADIPVMRTIDRLAWTLAGVAPYFFEEYAERHATRTGQWDSYVRFRDALSEGIGIAANGYIEMFTSIPLLLGSLKEADLADVPGIVAAVLVDGVTSALDGTYAFVYGDDVAAGHVAGSMVFEIRTGAVVGSAGVAARVVKSGRALRIAQRIVSGTHSKWRDAIVWGDARAARALRPRMRPAFAHVNAMASENVSRELSDAPRRGRPPRPRIDEAAARKAAEEEARLARAATMELIYFGLDPRMARMAASSPTFRATLETMREHPRFPRNWGDDRLRTIANVAHIGGAIQHNARAAERRYFVVPRVPFTAEVGRPGPSFDEYVRNNLPDATGRLGAARLNELRVRSEMLAKFPRRADVIKKAFRSSPDEDEVLTALANHKGEALAREELGLLYLRRPRVLEQHLERWQRMYREESEPYLRRGFSVRPENPSDTPRRYIDSHLATVRHLRRELDPQATIARHTVEPDQVLPMLRTMGVRGDQIPRIQGSPKLIADLDELSTEQWRVERPVGEVPVDAGRIGQPGTLWVDGNDYAYVADLSRRAGAGRFRREALWPARMREEDYVRENRNLVTLRAGEAALRSLEVRDELLRAFPDDARQIQAAFSIYDDEIDAVYARYLKYDARGEPAGREAAQRQIGERLLAESPIPNSFWRTFFAEQYRARLEELLYWGWWIPGRYAPI